MLLYRILVTLSENSKARSVIWRSLRGHGVAHFVAEPFRKPPLDFTLSFHERNASLVVCGPRMQMNRLFDAPPIEEVDLLQSVFVELLRMMLDIA